MTNIKYKYQITVQTFTNKNSIEREIAERQLGMKAINDNSWFSKLKQILAIY
jgi:hypothetical protein